MRSSPAIGNRFVLHGFAFKMAFAVDGLVGAAVTAGVGTTVDCNVGGVVGVGVANGMVGRGVG